MLLLLPALCSAGCRHGGGPGAFGSWGKAKGEPWTILCVEITDAERVSRTEALAARLRESPGIRAKDVRVVHESAASQLLYGTYFRQVDPETGRLTMPEALREDLRLVQRGGQGAAVSFIGARPISDPATHVGDPAYDLKRAEGVYTLLVAAFENTPEFYERKQAAAAYAAELRSKGYEAYYHHGRVASEVTVGSFGPDALVEASRQVRPQPGMVPHGVTLVTDYSAEVKALQAKEDFRFQLRNMHRVVVDRQGQRQYLASKLVRIRPGEDEW
jgi:hypothetical protein